MTAHVNNTLQTLSIPAHIGMRPMSILSSLCLNTTSNKFLSIIEQLRSMVLSPSARPVISSPSCECCPEGELGEVEHLEYSQSQLQTSRLLTIPVELQLHIFSYIFEPWLIVVAANNDYTEEPEHIFRAIRDDVLATRSRNSRLISGPPNPDPLLICRHIYNLVQPYYESSNCGHLYVDNIRKARRTGKAPTTLLPCPLRRYFPSIHTLHLKISRGINNTTLNTKEIFPNLRNAEIIIFSESAIPLPPRPKSVDDFLYGDTDPELIRLASKLVRNFILGPDTEDMIGADSDTQDSRSKQQITVDVKVVNPCTHTGTVAGFHYRQIGFEGQILSRVHRHRRRIAIWMDGDTTVQRGFSSIHYPDSRQRAKLDWFFSKHH